MATTKVSALAETTSPQANDELLINQSGVSKKVKITNLPAGADNTKLPLAGGTMTGDISLGDNVKAKFGDSDDLQIFHTGLSSFIENVGSGGIVLKTGNVSILSDTNEMIAQFASNGPVDLYHNDVKKLATTSTGIDVTGTVNGLAINGLAITTPATGNIGLGTGAVDAITTGDYNIGLGVNALNAATTGSNNIALGKGAGDSITTGSNNVCHGFFSGQAIGNQTLNTLVGYATGYNQNSTGNTALGASALYGGGNGAVSAYNTALGAYSGMYISSGAYNCALGAEALKGNSTSKLTGSYNIGIGYQTGYNLSSGANNQLIGYESGKALTTGSYNVTSGYQSGKALTTALDTIAIGQGAGSAITTGSSNIMIGAFAGRTVTGYGGNVMMGYYAGANFNGSNSVLIGYFAGLNATGSNKLHIANNSTESLIEGDFSAKTVNINGTLSATTITIPDNVIDEANLQVSNSPTNGYMLTAQSGNTGGLTWAAASGGGGIGEYFETNNIVVSYKAGQGDALTSSADDNVMLGSGAGGAVTSGDRGVYIGFNAGGPTTSGTHSIFIGNSVNQWAAASSNNIGLGYAALTYNTGSDNIALGRSSLYGGASGLSGTYNIGIGYQTGYSLSSGSNNQLIGYQSGKALTTATYNILSGYESGKALTTGSYNVFSGYRAGSNLTTGGSNTLIGTNAGKELVAGSLKNTAIGFDSLNTLSSTTLWGNTAVGYRALASNPGSKNNTAIGYDAGRLTDGAVNGVYIGYQAGYQDTDDNKLHIANNSTESLIEGDFSAKTLNINGALTVNGAAVGGGAMEFVSKTTVTGTPSSIGITGLDDDSVYKIIFPYVTLSANEFPKLKFYDQTDTLITSSDYRYVRLDGSASNAPSNSADVNCYGASGFVWEAEFTVNTKVGKASVFMNQTNIGSSAQTPASCRIRAGFDNTLYASKGIGGIQINTSGGTFTGGEYRIYKIKDS